MQPSPLHSVARLHSPTSQELALKASVGSAADQERSNNPWSGFSRLKSWEFVPSFPSRLGICMKVPCFGLPTLLSQIDVNHHFHAFLGRTLHVSCVCARVCVCDCVVFFVKGDFLKIRTQFAVKMLLCIIYFFFLHSDLS